MYLFHLDKFVEISEEEKLDAKGTPEGIAKPIDETTNPIAEVSNDDLKNLSEPNVEKVPNEVFDKDSIKELEEDLDNKTVSFWKLGQGCSNTYLYKSWGKTQ